MVTIAGGASAWLVCVSRVGWIAVGACIVAVLSSCSEGTGLVQTSDEPFVHIVLALEPAQPSFSDSVVRALLLTTGSPIRSPFRTAQLFDMRRVSDDARFSWNVTPGSTDTPVGFRDVSISQGNYALAETGSEAGLGRQDLRPGEAYTLRIETEGRVVAGRVRMPDTPVLVFARQGNSRSVSWQKVGAAGGYRVVTNTERFKVVALTRDTLFELLFDEVPMPASPEIRVTAVDSNLYRYITDFTLPRAGISGGFGVFGAISPTAKLALPKDS